MSFQVISIILTAIIIVVMFFQVWLLLDLKKSVRHVKCSQLKAIDIQIINKQLKEEIRTTILLKMYATRNAVQKQTLNIHVKAMENAPQVIGINEDIMIKVFSDQEIKLIKQYWYLFQQYVSRYWLNQNGRFKTVFSGEVGKKTGDVGQMIIASEQLIHKLDKLLESYQDETTKVD